MPMENLGAPSCDEAHEWDLKSNVCILPIISNGNLTRFTAPRKPVSNGAVPSPIPPPVFYDKEKPDMKIGTPEVRNTNVQAVNAPSPTIYREQQTCEICHKKNRGEEMLLCDGCDCGRYTYNTIQNYI